ncbi:acyl-CoA dehydrogenase family protein [Streptomyces sp. DSM 41524]|uniref:Acyl-CoA dehydrogenase family protein n=1 Tax=Streptomyces asiaticus subsp. ignotus TaxID=3098222 RepID=A0ABU7Q6T5_9ACTN|nr:acyl-CoA dehydrogenase family protein [Streptomyces sp. DSM 41524]
MPVDRLLPHNDAADLLQLAREIAAKELAPRAGQAEADHAFPRDIFRMLGASGLLGLPYPEKFGGGGLPYETYLQVLEEIAAAWMSVGVGMSVHVMSAYPLFAFGTDEQRERWLPGMLGGDTLGAFSLSESEAGSDIAAMTTRATRTADGWTLSGRKAWVTHGGRADYYTLMARTSDDGAQGISVFLVPADASGLTADAPERKMGLTGSVTAQVSLARVAVAHDRLIGDEGRGVPIALSALDSGRLGIAACATGLAQAALDTAVAYARERTQFGRRIIDHQGLSFLLADMEAAVVSARATYLDAARRRDRGMPFTQHAAVAKLVATDVAMRVTTDAVQVLGGAGYTRDFPVERFMREAKVTQIFEGTNQIQRLVIGRALATL